MGMYAYKATYTNFSQLLEMLLWPAGNFVPHIHISALFGHLQRVKKIAFTIPEIVVYFKTGFFEMLPDKNVKEIFAISLVI